MVFNKQGFSIDLKGSGETNALRLSSLNINRCISVVTTVKQVVLHTTYQADGKSF